MTRGNRGESQPGDHLSDLRGPRLASHVILRSRLLEALNAQSPLTLLRAPLGFGKTALLAQWYQSHQQESTLWVSVTSDATDAPGFWQAVLDALVDAGQAPAAANVRTSTRAQVGRAIAGARQPLTLIVDGFDRVSADGVESDLLDLLRTCPNLRLIVSLRGRGHFRPYQHLDLDVTVIPPTALRFTLAETKSLLDQVSGKVSDEQAELIQNEAGGWPELTLAFAVALRERTHGGDRTPLDSRATTRIARDYLRQRILPAIDGREQVMFALSTSVVEEVSADIAEALVDEGSADAHLERIEVAGGLSANAEHGEVAYRWPPAVRRALAEELQRVAPDRARHVHRRIARWHLKQKRPELTLDHAVRARDWQLVLLTIEHYWLTLLLDEPQHLFAALAAIPLEVSANRPKVIAMHALRFPTADQALLAALPSLPTGTRELAKLGSNPEAAEILDTGLALLIALRWKGLFPQARAYSRQLETLATSVRRTSSSGDIAAALPCLFLQFALVHLLADDLSGGFDLLKVAFDLGGNQRSLEYVPRETVSKLALTSALAGETQRAADWIDRCDQLPPEPRWLGRYVAQAPTTAEALLALDRLDIDSAAAALDTAAGVVEADEFLAFTTYARALVALYREKPELGLDELDQFRTSYPAWYADGSTARPLLASVEVDLLIAANQGNRARATLIAAGQEHALLRGAAARLALLGGNAKAALDLAIDTSARPVSRRLQIEMLVARAVAQHRLGNAPAATRALSRALGMAATTGALRPFSTVPRAELMEIAEQLPPARVELLNAPPLANRPDLFPSHVTLIDLTDRERLVLGQLAQGLPLRNIAKNLYVSVNTVKTQCRSLYQKLEASSRRQAVARARESGLLRDPPYDATS